MHALIDGDPLIYVAAVKAETNIDWGDSIVSRHANGDLAKATLKELVAGMVEKVGADTFTLAVTIGDNFRFGVLPTYKSNRNPATKPLLVGPLRAWALEHYGKQCKWVETLEGDDVLGILATHPTLVPDKDRVICSIDKDFKTIPGKFFDYGRDIRYDLSEDDANYHWMWQTLVGDVTDGYKGCPGVGPKTADSLLTQGASLEELWEIVLARFKKAKLGETEALQQARVARILRNGDYDFREKKVKLWTP